jgi:SAM-dependent methyltransferase
MSLPPESRWRESLVSGAVRERIDELVRTDSAVRTLQLILGRPKIYEWALSVGSIADPVLGATMPPLPDVSLRRITSDDEPEVFLWTGLSDVFTFLEILEAQGMTRRSNLRLLDFGCGCGRLLRFLRGLAADHEITGSDVNPDHVAWCRAHLAPVRFSKNGLRPPLERPTGTLDGIWSLSVFTHLDDDLGSEWRAELTRVLAPLGVLILTLHGETALGRAESDPTLAARLGWKPEHLRTVRARLQASGTAYVPYEGISLSSANAGENYGLHYATERHVRALWSTPSLELVDYRPGGLRGWQDVAVFRKRD